MWESMRKKRLRYKTASLETPVASDYKALMSSTAF